MPLFFGTANSDRVNGVGSAPVPRFLAVPSTTKYIGLGTCISRASFYACVNTQPCRAVEKKSVFTVKMLATPVLGPVSIFKPARQKDKCKRAVPCRKKVAPFQAQAVPCTKRHSVNGDSVRTLKRIRTPFVDRVQDMNSGTNTSE